MSVAYRADANSFNPPSSTVTRSYKTNDRDHKAIIEGRVLSEDQVPRFFGRHGHSTNPKKTKKDGSGKGNWGTVGNEIVDEEFTFAKTRRRSNSSGYSNHLFDFKTKFDVNEPEPVFEESLHGPLPETEHEADTMEMDLELSKTMTSDSSSSSSISIA